MKRSLIFLAGGQGVRMNEEIPKQFLKIHGKEIALHSFERFLSNPHIDEIVVVTHQDWRRLFQTSKKKILFANPGNRRQDSVRNGFLQLKEEEKVVAIHDSARPYITNELIERVYEAGATHGAATCSMPITFTLKRCDQTGSVTDTVDRNHLHEIQTPQAITYSLLKKGLKHALERNLDVTDDVSLIEMLGHAPKLVKGLRKNLKVTYPDDIDLMELYLA
jgi:2-C-methyl-D-erythritol 4-phosphate cytidylyltransferase